MWKDLDVRGTPSVCCSGQEMLGWMASGVLPHKDPVPFRCSLEEPLSVSWHSQTPCSSRAEPGFLQLLDHHPVPRRGPRTGGVAQKTSGCLTRESQAPTCSQSTSSCLQFWVLCKTGRKADSGHPNTSP